MRFKTGQGLPIETIIIILIAVLVLVIVIIIFISQTTDISQGFKSIISSVVNLSRG